MVQCASSIGAQGASKTDIMKLEIYFIRFLYCLLTLFAAGMVSLCLWGCDPVKQVARKDARNAVKSSKLFNKADQKSHANVADLCGQRFPPVASTKDEIIPGETIIIHDTATKTIEKSGDTVIITYHDTVKVRRTDTVRQTIVKVNNAALYASQDSNTKMRVVLADKDAKIALSNQSRDGWRTKCLYTWGILAILIILKIAISYIKSKTNILKSVKWLKN